MNKYKFPNYDSHGTCPFKINKALFNNGVLFNNGLVWGHISHIMAFSEYTPAKILDIIASKYTTINNMPSTLMYHMASNKNASCNLLYRIYNEDQSSLALLALCTNENIPSDILSDIIDKYYIPTKLYDDSSMLMQKILNNKSTPRYILQKIINNTSSDNFNSQMYYSFINHPNCPEDFI